ncbi:choice-of-anchor D domain-containing protein [Amycolatopsis sp. lyj-84]|uniref:choice-of-anchor D domain-containing protein n=1 Tax=Amycolatopsis sp. lyj-84 TaxID=2789284 RepID=UPI00397C7247
MGIRRFVTLAVAVTALTGEVTAWGDTSPGGTEVVSVAQDGTAGTGLDPDISGNARYVAFSSTAPLDPLAAPSGLSTVYVRDRSAPGRTMLISRGYPIEAFTLSAVAAPWEAPANGSSGSASISADGRYVAFATEATNIADGYVGYGRHIVVADRDPDGDGSYDEPRADGGMDYGFVSLGVPNETRNDRPSLSGDGTTIAWNETDSEDTRVVVARLAKDSSGALAPPDPTTYRRLAPEATVGTEDRPRVSADGTQVVFGRASCEDCEDRATSVWVHDVGGAKTGRVDSGAFSGRARRPSVSGNGRLIAFEHREPDGTGQVVVADRNSPSRVFVASRDASGAATDSAEPALSGDGRYLTFLTSTVVLVRDLTVDTAREQAGLPRLDAELASPSAGPCGTCPANGPSTGPALSSNGSVTVFASAADDLVPGCCAGSVFARVFRPTVSGDATDYGTVTVGESAERTITVRHNGFGPLKVDSVAVAGPSAGDFVVSTAETCAGAVLHTTGTCLVTISFRPVAPGRKDAALVVTAGGAPVAIALTGGAGPPRGGLTVDPPSVVFGEPVLALSPAGSRLVRVGITGGVPITVERVSIAAGPRFSAEDFAITATTCAPAVLAPGATCTIEVTASPRGAGQRIGALLIQAAPPELSLLVPLQDAGIAPAVSLSPAVARPRRVVQLTGSGFPAAHDVTVAFGGFTTTVRTGADGAFGAPVLVPAYTDIGDRRVVAAVPGLPLTAEAPLLVQPGTYQPPNFTSRR